MLRRSDRSRTSLIFLGLLVIPTLIQAADWNQFRGPQGNPVDAEREHPSNWSETSNVGWKVPIPGHGWSQPIVTGDHVFVTSAVSEDEETPIQKDKRPFVPEARDATQDVYQWKVFCLSAKTGEVLWQRTAYEGKPTRKKHRNNTYASETPATDGEVVIAYFGNRGVVCYDLKGERLWSKEFEEYPMQAGWGTGSSCVIYEDGVFIQCDNEKSSFLIKLNKRTGAPMWRVERDETSNWSTPYVWKNKLRSELVAAGGKSTRSYDLATGKVLWSMKASGRTSLTPIADQELIYVDSVDRIRGNPGRLAAIRPGASGDISLPNGDDESLASNEFIAWSKNLTFYRNASPALHDGCLYMVEQGSKLVHCFNAKTGELHFKNRLPDTSGFFASPWANGKKVYFLDDSGLTVAIESGPVFKVISSSRLNDDMFWASIAMYEDRLFIRGLRHLYCIQK